MDPNPQSRRPDLPYYAAAALCGIFAGWVDVKEGDLLFTALLVLAPCIILGALRPARPWRWVLTLGVFLPLMELFAYVFFAQKPYRAQIYESFLAFLPGVAGAYGGSLGRGVLNNLGIVKS